MIFVIVIIIVISIIFVIDIVSSIIDIMFIDVNDDSSGLGLLRYDITTGSRSVRVKVMSHKRLTIFDLSVAKTF